MEQEVWTCTIHAERRYGLFKGFRKMRIFIKENKVTQVWWNMRIRISINDSIEYLKVVDSPANHKRIVKKMYGNWYIAEAMHF